MVAPRSGRTLRSLRGLAALLLAACATAVFVVAADFGGSIAYAAFAPLAPAAPGVPASAKRRSDDGAGAPAPVKLYVFGDSLAFGYQATPGHGWVDEFRRRLRQKRPGSVVLNAAVCGARLRDIGSQLAKAPAGDADAVLLVAGANDIMFPTNPFAVAFTDRALLRRIHRRYPHARVLVANVPDLSWRSFNVAHYGPERLPPPFQAGIALLTSVDNAVIGATAHRYGDEILDLHRLIAAGTGGAPGLGRMSQAEFDQTYISSDGLHPNDRGYAMLAEYAWPAVARAVRVTE